MKSFTKYLAPSLLLTFIVLVAGFSRASYVAQTEVGADAISSPTLTITYFDQPYETFLAYRAELVAPSGTEIQIRNGKPYTVEDADEPYVFVLTHNLYSSPNDDWPRNNIPGDSFVESLMLSKQLQEIGVFTPIPGSGTRLESFASVRRSVSFVRPGIYTLEEGERFILSRIEDTEFYINVIQVPN